MTARTLVLVGIAAALPPQIAHAQEVEPEKLDLTVLFVGDDPEAPKILFADSADTRTVELHKERTAAFEGLLKARFERVRVVFGDNYDTSLSEDVDVTIFDTRPKALSPSSRTVNPETGETDYQPARYLPEDFDHPAITIAANSPTIGEPLGLKLDWL